MSNQPLSEITDNGPRGRDREKTLTELNLALNRLQKKGVKLSIAAVAKEAGVTNALLHNVYPDFTEEIRKLNGKGIRADRDAKHDSLMIERGKNRELREEIDELRKDIIKLASSNESLRAELVLQKGIADGKVTQLRP